MDVPDPRSLYIHFPFCSSRCGYCGFYSTVATEETALISKYMEELLLEWSFRKVQCRFPLKTVYMGGGTPGLLSETFLKPLVNCLRNFTDDNTEWTIECNPEHLTAEKLEYYNQSPINRISLGIQSLNDSDLKVLERSCSSERAMDCMKLLSEKWIGRWSVDLLHAIPGENNKLQSTLKRIIPFNPGHISLYTLIFEEGTPLYNGMEQGNIIPVEQDLQDDLWNSSVSFLKKNGYSRYEISNFCHKNEESRHNSGYWKLEPYVGLGAGAVSMTPDSQGTLIRYQNEPSVEKYLKKSYCCTDYERICGENYIKDLVLMGLRTRRGIDKKVLENHLPKAAEEIFKTTFKKYASYFHITSYSISLNNDGMDILNTILVEMFLEIESLFLDS